ncbi:MAG: ftnB [Proteobacteria bacterium]|nr:ftnB [Pseudomonadota bacterium]
MLPCELSYKLNQHMNREFRCAGTCIARSSWLLDTDHDDIAYFFRVLAQSSITRTIKFYNFLSKCQEIPFINPDISVTDKNELSLPVIINELLLDFQIRNENISAIEKIAAKRSNIKTSLFIANIRVLYRDEAQLLLSTIETHRLKENTVIM